jgi:YHS domain-containing protein
MVNTMHARRHCVTGKWTIACVTLAALAAWGCGKSNGQVQATPPATVTTLASPPAAAKEQTSTEQTMCPIMGGPVNHDIFVDYKGKRIYFCCNACPPVFNKDPEKYIKEMESKGIVLSKTPAATP